MNGITKLEVANRLNYWEKNLNGAPALLSLPLDRSRPSILKPETAKQSINIDELCLTRLKKIAHETKTDSSTLLFVIFNILLMRYANQDDIVVGVCNITPSTHHYLPIRTFIDQEESFDDLLKKVKQTILDASIYQDITEEQLINHLQIEKSTGYAPIQQVLFNYQPDKLSKDSSQNNKQSYDLIMFIKETQDGLLCELQYNVSLFKETSIKRMLAHWQLLVNNTVKNPKQKISTIEMISTDEKKQLMDWNNTSYQYPQLTINVLFEEQVRKTPESIALVFGEKRITFAELNNQANKVAHHLIKADVGPEKIVVLCCERSVDLIVAIIAIIKAGGAYIVIDSDYPKQRITQMFEEINPTIYLCNSQFLKTNEWIGRYDEQKTLLLDTLLSAQELDASPNPSPSTNPSSLLYLIYTSGSTGQPKGILGTHLGIVNKLQDLWKKYPFSDNETCCQKTSFNFVDHIAEIFSPLLQGATLHLLSSNAIKGDIDTFTNEIIEAKITRITLVPTLLKTLLSHVQDSDKKLPHLKYVVSSGEALSVNTSIAFYKQIPDALLINLYGSSEVGADCIGHEVTISELNKIKKYFEEGLTNVEKYLNGHHVDNSHHTKLHDLFQNYTMPDKPISFEKYQDYLHNDVLPNLVNVSSPSYIGHMTSVLPSFSHKLNDLISVLNQNVVKIETSKALTFLERETLAIMHHAFFKKDEQFYKNNIQNPAANVGVITSGGTQANMTALWVARNALFKAEGSFKGIAEEGLVASLKQYGYKEIIIIVSPLLHYSIYKSASILGLGQQNIKLMPLNKNGTVNLTALEEDIKKYNAEKICIAAIIGIAGATETGSIDPLNDLSDIAQKNNIHFHVDAAFGGPFIFSKEHHTLLNGIEHADSITICGHKQLHLPMGLSLCLFKNPNLLEAIYVTTDYQAIKSGFDFGKASLEGSRPALSLLLHANLHLLGKTGYSDILDDSVKKAKQLQELIEENPSFELLWKPDINIVNYRYIPQKFRHKLQSKSLTPEDNKQIDEANILLQKLQFEKGDSFISKTSLPYLFGEEEVISMRAVIANPLTTHADLVATLEDQLMIAHQHIEKDVSDGQQLKIKTNEMYDSLAQMVVPIGKPLINTHAFILNNNLGLSGIGIPGELYIAGFGLAKGYLNKPDLTKERFVANPFSAGPYALMYKTGDICRYLEDGTIEYIGRKDHQVKIRGFRIELGEIENALQKNNAIKDAAVIDREDIVGERYLVGYVVAKDASKELSIESIKKSLQEIIPNYMIPAVIVTLPQLPLTPGGKINRKALPKPEIKSTTSYVAPRNDLEESMCQVFKEAMHLEQIGVFDNFFELGINSLSAAIIAYKLSKITGSNITWAMIYSHPTIDAITCALDNNQFEAVSVNNDDLSSYMTMKKIPMSNQQTLFWFLEKPGNWFNASFIDRKRVEGPLDIQALYYAFDCLFNKNTVFTFYINKLSPVLHAAKSLDFTIDQEDFSMLPNEQMEERLQKSLMDLKDALKRKKRPPYCIVKLCKLPNGQSELQLCISHIILDEKSVSLVFNELSKYYLEYFDTSVEKTTIEKDYQFLVPLNNEKNSSPEKNEKNAALLSDYISDASNLVFPKQDIIPNYSNCNYSFYQEISKDIVNKLTEFCNKKGINKYDYIDAVVCKAMQKYSDSSKALACYVVNSTRNREDLFHAIGHFLETNLIKVQLKNTDNIELAKQIQHSKLETSNYQNCDVIIKDEFFYNNIRQPRIINRCINGLLAIYGHLNKESGINANKLASFCNYLLAPEKKDYFTLNVDVHNAFLEDAVDTQLFGLNKVNLDLCKDSQLIAPDIVVVIFTRDDKNTRYLHINAPLKPEILSQIGKNIIDLIQSDLERAL